MQEKCLQVLMLGLGTPSFTIPENASNMVLRNDIAPENRTPIKLSPPAPPSRMEPAFPVYCAGRQEAHCQASAEWETQGPGDSPCGTGELLGKLSFGILIRIFLFKGVFSPQ